MTWLWPSGINIQYFNSALSHQIWPCPDRKHEPVAVFLQFTTGERHPLSLETTVSLPTDREPEVEVLGDYLLVTGKARSFGKGFFSVVSWKTGTYTEVSGVSSYFSIVQILNRDLKLYKMFGLLKVVIIDLDKSLIALMKSASNSIHICKLQFLSAQPSLHTLCSLSFPRSMYHNRTSVHMRIKEWLPTAKPRDQTGSQTSRGRPFPFRPYRADTILLILSFKQDQGVQKYAMFVSVEALLSVVNSGTSRVPWVDWGPAGTRILPLGKGFLPRTAGPFWITSYAPLVFRDYTSLSVRYFKKQKKSIPPIPPYPSLEPPSTKLFGEHWDGGEIKTHVPFRKFVAGGLAIKRIVQVVADREWIVVISRTVRCLTLLHASKEIDLCVPIEQWEKDFNHCVPRGLDVANVWPPEAYTVTAVLCEQHYDSRLLGGLYNLSRLLMSSIMPLQPETSLRYMHTSISRV